LRAGWQTGDACAQTRANNSIVIIGEPLGQNQPNLQFEVRNGAVIRIGDQPGYGIENGPLDFPLIGACEQVEQGYVKVQEQVSPGALGIGLNASNRLLFSIIKVTDRDQSRPRLLLLQPIGNWIGTIFLQRCGNRFGFAGTDKSL